MARTKYPLKPLEQLREQKSDAAKEALAAAVSAREAQERAVLSAAERARSHEAARDAQVAAEQGRLAEGVLRASDMAMLEAYRLRADAEVEALHARTREEEEALEARARAQTEAQSALAARKAELSVVEKDHAKWDLEQRKRREAAEEEAAQEAFVPKKG